MSTDGVVAVLESSDLSFGGSVGTVGTATITLAETGLEALAAFPFASDVAALALAAGILAGRVLFEYWFVSAAVAAAGWLFLYRLGQRVSADRHDRLYNGVNSHWRSRNPSPSSTSPTSHGSRSTTSAMPLPRH